MTMPNRVVDCHHHYFDPATNPFSSFLKDLGVPAYLPAQYDVDIGELAVVKTVHVEAMADDGEGHGEVAWVEQLAASGAAPKVAAIVAACNLASPEAAEKLALIKAASTKVKGVRFILDYDGGDFDGGKNATHVSIKRYGQDFLRGAEAAKFESGFGLLADLGLSFDLQCAPAQLLAAAALFGRHPKVPVAICHLGKPRGLKADGSAEDTATLEQWRTGMKAVATQPQVYVKLSMLGYAVPGWAADPAKESFLKGLIDETIELFGPNRCMFATNWHINGAVSNSDGADEVALTASELYAKFQCWIADRPEADQRMLMAGTAEAFYRI